MLRKITWLAVVLACCCNILRAGEPNETFGQATVLAPSVLSVSDDLTPGFVSYPDTYLGTIDFFGSIQYEDDDSSEYGDGYASGLSVVPINPGGTIDFLVTGCCDYSFFGDHVYSGDFEVVVDVYDFFGDFVETVRETRMLQPGVVEEFSFFGDEDWISGTYDVNIDNTVGGTSGGDVDFFTFTGLTVGDQFIAEVMQNPNTGFDSILGWFDESGNLVASDDQGGTENLSRLEGAIPSNGRLTFAVTGYDDFDFLGAHGQEAEYSLQLTIIPDEPGGDFDSDGDVDGKDFLTWQRNPSVGNLGDWQTNYGGGLLTAAVAVPEPSALLLLMGLGGVWLGRHR